ncbi:hypothetical protein [Agrobacterium tumefaciens]|uniref:hypothetical protein n=1 Tax=Agrobacterium tumefaciens TaxID=358 RepID=UPI001BABF292|nr:hypothetical protein [Agrobacterium tumefaciens]
MENFEGGKTLPIKKATAVKATIEKPAIVQLENPISMTRRSLNIKRNATGTASIRRSRTKGRRVRTVWNMLHVAKETIKTSAVATA